jgi:hypothetical protein
MRCASVSVWRRRVGPVTGNEYLVEVFDASTGAFFGGGLAARLPRSLSGSFEGLAGPIESRSKKLFAGIGEHDERSKELSLRRMCHTSEIGAWKGCPYSEGYRKRGQGNPETTLRADMAC